MASQQTLSAEKRDVTGSTAGRRLRREGIVPAVVYGSTQRAYTIQVTAKEFGNVLKAQSSNNFLVNLEIKGADEKSKLAMVQDLQQDPLTGSILHIDFHAVNENETIHAEVPIFLVGEAAGVKNGGLLEHLIHSIEIHCLPSQLPDHIEFDVSELETGESASIGDLKFPEGVEPSLGAEVIFTIVNEPRLATEEEEAEDAAAAAAAAEPEVLREKSDDAEGDSK